MKNPCVRTMSESTWQVGHIGRPVELVRAAVGPKGKVGELTSKQDGIFRQYLIERLMGEIMKFDGEFRREDAASLVAAHVRH